LDDAYKAKIEAVQDLILSEVNVKALELVDEAQTQIVKQFETEF
jgi:isoleucyl-tRNA synthetase